MADYDDGNDGNDGNGNGNDAPDDADQRFALLEMDAPTTPEPMAPTTPKVAPAITVAPVAASPLDAGRALLGAALTVAALTDAAQAVAKQCVAAGFDAGHPTRVALREVYRARRAHLIYAVLVGAWLRLWGSLRAAIEARPHVWADGLPHSLPASHPVGRVVPAMAPVATGLDLGATLGGIAAEGASNAASQASGSLAAGSMQSVGFSTASGYVTALANGTKEPTTGMYLATLRSRFGYTPAQIAGLTIGVLAQSTLPAGAGVVVDNTAADGLDVFDRARAAAAAAAQLVRDTADATTLALAQRLVVTDSPDAWWEIGWDGVGSITRAELVAATGDVTLAPAAKINSTQLARTIDSLRGTHDAAMVTLRPAGVKVRWQIGRGKQHAAFVGAEYGHVLAICDLCADNTLSFDGDTTIANEVRAEYDRLLGDEVLRPGDVTSWLQQVLRHSFGGVRNGGRYLISPQHKRGARELCAQIATVWAVGHWVQGGISDAGVPELGVTYKTVAMVIGGIWQGLAGEVTDAEERWAKTVTDAEAKTKRPGVRACVSEMERIDGTKPGDGLMARLGQLAIIGEGPLAPLRARVTALRTAVKAALDEANDPTAERFANLELT